ncbi:MAG: hypothetical protein NVS1B2_13780 [Vulcanimicrobiaceae bacterium]
MTHPDPVGHGYCLVWDPRLLWTHVLADAFIAVAYFSIPIALLLVLRSRGKTPFGTVIALFIAFIVLCGTTHVLDIVNVWVPVYWLSAAVEVATALISILTAIALVPMIPLLIKAPDPYVDVVTSLPNRAVLLDRIEQASARAVRARDTFALLFINFDLTTPREFATGRNFGNLVLSAVAERFRATMRSVDTVALAGGMEFVVVAEGLDDDGLRTVIRRLASEATRPLPIGSERIALSARIAFVVSDGSIDPIGLIDRAQRRSVADLDVLEAVAAE